MAELLERRTCNSEAPSSSPALDLFKVVPSSNPRPRSLIADWFAFGQLRYLTLLTSI